MKKFHENRANWSKSKRKSNKLGLLNRSVIMQCSSASSVLFTLKASNVGSGNFTKISMSVEQFEEKKSLLKYYLCSGKTIVFAFDMKNSRCLYLRQCVLLETNLLWFALVPEVISQSVICEIWCRILWYFSVLLNSNLKFQPANQTFYYIFKHQLPQSPGSYGNEKGSESGK